MKPASVADMNIRRSFGDFVVSLSIKNLFNERYSENFGNSIYDRNYPMPGRGIYFKVGFH
jgi:outer membrane receptor protein involved in Fe transport